MFARPSTTRRLHRLSGLLAASALLTASAPLHAADDKAADGWTAGGSKAAKLKDFTPKMSEEESYIERYSISMDVDGGGWIGAYFTISNFGLGDGHGAARLRIKLPGRKKEYAHFEKVDRDEWSFKEDTLDLTISGLRLKAKDASGFELTFASPDGEVKLELEVTHTLPMWQPGRGRIDVADGGYLAYGVLSPRGTAKGRVFIDGEWRDLSATKTVFADHSASNVAPFDLATHFGHSRAYKDDVTVAWRTIRLSEKYGGQTFTWVMVGYKDEIVLSDADATLKTGDVKRDKKTGYNVPYTVQVQGKSGKDHVKLVARGEKMKRKDLLDKYGSAAKLVAGAVSNPYRYEFQAPFAMELTVSGAEAKVGGESNYYFDFMN